MNKYMYIYVYIYAQLPRAALERPRLAVNPSRINPLPYRIALKKTSCMIKPKL